MLSSQIKLNDELNVIYKKMTNKSFDEILYYSRTRFGSKLLESKRAMIYLKNNLDKVNILAVVADQSPTKINRKLWFNMLNQKTAFYESVEYIPRFVGGFVYFASMERIKRGYYSVRFDLIGKPPFSKKSNILTAYIKNIEDLIKKKPEEWLWSHKRWKLNQ